MTLTLNVSVHEPDRAMRDWLVATFGRQRSNQSIDGGRLPREGEPPQGSRGVARRQAVEPVDVTAEHRVIKFNGKVEHGTALAE